MCGFSTIFDLKHRAWQVQVCQSPDFVVTVIVHGSTSESSMNSPQKGQGPLKVTSGICVQPPNRLLSRSSSVSRLRLHPLAVFADEIDEAACVASIQQVTRQYAKRQMTWFRRERHFQEVVRGTEESDEAVAERVIRAIH